MEVPAIIKIRSDSKNPFNLSGSESNLFFFQKVKLIDPLGHLTNNLRDGILLKSMHCSTNGFSLLKYLTLDYISHLDDWKVGVGAMPILCELTLEDCKNLKIFP
jgi:hypothetical protein